MLFSGFALAQLGDSSRSLFSEGVQGVGFHIAI